MLINKKSILKEFKELLGKTLDYNEIQKLIEILEINFEIVHYSEYQQMLFFDSPREILKHIKLTGTNAISQFIWKKRELLDFETLYSENFNENGRTPLTYHPIIILARRKN